MNQVRTSKWILDISCFFQEVGRQVLSVEWTWWLFKDDDLVNVGAFSLEGARKGLEHPHFSCCLREYRWLDTESRDFQLCRDVSTFRSERSWPSSSSWFLSFHWADFLIPLPSSALSSCAKNGSQIESQTLPWPNLRSIKIPREAARQAGASNDLVGMACLGNGQEPGLKGRSVSIVTFFWGVLASDASSLK